MTYPDQPTDKAELLARIQTTHQQLEDVLAPLSAKQMERHILDGNWAIKDMLAHITFWEQRLLVILRNAAQGQDMPNLIEPDEDWHGGVDRVNAAAYAASLHRPLAEIRADYAASFAEVVATVTATPDDALFAPTGYSRLFEESVIELIAGNTYGHYEEHIPMLQPAPASALILRAIDATNWAICTRLAVGEGQEDFVANNAYSLVQAAYTEGLIPLGMYAGPQMVGFVMYSTKPDEKDRYWIFRVLVDHAFQGHGYGRAAMVQVIERMRAIPHCHHIALDFHQKNSVAERLYASLGFQHTGEVDGTDIIASLALDA